jgi:hypothetical protein
MKHPAPMSDENCYRSKYLDYEYKEGAHCTTLTNTELGDSFKHRYLEGFHIYSDLKSAINKVFSWNGECIVEVIGWNIIAEGIDSDEDVFVARNMRIMRKVIVKEVAYVLR